ncbi:uncharacterized protein LOC134189041 isoform X2 [Corticium candelabrum]|uniref:uncharacterized protein LOC134189041 isoform X2 n=1 Tax=Corticium candelabrum TaxID=121492 RepID=UPI002E25220C|nr:uncharacterized protein LOC134189041 isoform X2 [Corticium candelabrum]
MVIHEDMATPASSVATSSGGKSPSAQTSQRLTCKICGATFVYPGSFTKHMQRHEMSNKRSQESSPSPSSMLMSDSTPSMVTSKSLQQVVPQPPAVSPSTAPSMNHSYFPNSREVEEVSASNSMRCQVCGRQFKYKSCLITHIETKHPQGQYAPSQNKLSAASRMPALQCDFCGEVFVYHANLMKHKHKVHRELMHTYSNTVKQQPLIQALSPVSGPSHLTSPRDIKPNIEPYPQAALSAFTPTLPSRQVPGDVVSPGYRTGESSSDTSQRQAEKPIAPEGGSEEDEKALAEGSAFHQRFPRNSYECPVCKMTFVYGTSFMKHMSRYHPGEEVPYMGPVSRENHLKQIATVGSDGKKESHADAADRNKDNQCPDLMSIFETASLRIAGIKQEGLKNLSSEFSFSYNSDGGEREWEGQHDRRVSSNGEVSSGEIDRHEESESGDSDGAAERNENKQQRNRVMERDVGSEALVSKHASVIVDPSDSHVFDMHPQVSALQQSAAMDSPMSPKNSESQSSGQEIGRKYYMCPVCQMEFVYGASFIKHMRRFHPGVDFELPKTGKGRTPSLTKGEDPSAATAPEWKLSGPMWVDYSPKSSGRSPPKSQSLLVSAPPVTVTNTVATQPVASVSPPTTQSNSSGDQYMYHAKRTRQCPCCSAVFVYVGSLIKHMQKCHPGSTWLSDSSELRNYLKQEKPERASSATAVSTASPVRVPIQTRKASLHKHLLDHGVTPDEVVRLSSLTNPKEDVSSSVPASVLSGMSMPPLTQHNTLTDQMMSLNTNSSMSGIESSAKRAKLMTGEEFNPMHTVVTDSSLDDMPQHQMSLRSRANRLPVNYAEMEMEEGEMANIDDEQNAGEFSESSGTPYVSYQQAHHTVMSCLQQAYNALVALENIQGLARFDQPFMLLSPVAALFEGDSQGVSVLKSVTSSVAGALQSAGHLGVALADLQSMLNQRVDEMNRKMVSAVYSETIQVGKKSLVVEAPAVEGVDNGGCREEAVDDERRLGIPSMEEELRMLERQDSEPLTPPLQIADSPTAKSTSSQDTEISPDKFDDNVEPNHYESKETHSKSSHNTRGKRRKTHHSVSPPLTESDDDSGDMPQTSLN